MISYSTCVNSNIELRYLIFAIRVIAGKRSKSGMHVSVPIARVYDIWMQFHINACVYEGTYERHIRHVDYENCFG